ncbi:MAG: hypothetical protein GXP50_06965 [Deltaproteobacteria bacterium]|nr:hypothetical protein [Deltaproteobacteria bacterium]
MAASNRAGAPPARFDHVGFVVEDLEAATRAFDALLGPPVIRSIPEVGLEARVYLGGGVEVLWFAGEVEGIDPRATRPRPGVHHLAVRVEDLDGCLASLGRDGVPVLQGFPRPGLHGRIAFVEDPVSGGLLELVEAGA